MLSMCTVLWIKKRSFVFGLEDYNLRQMQQITIGNEYYFSQNNITSNTQLYHTENDDIHNNKNEMLIGKYKPSVESGFRDTSILALVLSAFAPIIQAE